MGGPGSEREVSLNSGRNVLSAFRSKENTQRYIAVPIEIRDPKKVLAQLALAKPDVAFSVVHGTFGEDGVLQSLLEIARVPYVGSGVLASALAMNKKLSSFLVNTKGVRVPRETKKIPCVVKPNDSGSSVGVTIVKNKKDLAKAIKLASKEGGPIIQEFVPGTELTCGVLKFEKGKPTALPVTEIVPKSKFFDYKAKYTKGGSEEITPARISKKLTQEVQEAALLAHKTLGCRHISRSDFILSKDKIYYLETNTSPGMTNTSLIPQAAAVAGLSMPDLCDRLVRAALLQ